MIIVDVMPLGIAGTINGILQSQVATFLPDVEVEVKFCMRPYMTQNIIFRSLEGPP